MAIAEVFEAYPALLILTALTVGLMVGSFLNVVIYRLPVMMEREWTHECKLLLDIDQDQTDNQKADTFNLAVPNSHCPNCNAPVKAGQNIPVISYFLLKGRCANCQTTISVRYPIIETITGLLSAYAVWHFGFTTQALLALLFTWCLITLTMIDADHKLLPDQITLPLLWLGILAGLFNQFVSIEDAVWGAIAGYLSLWSVYWAFKLLTGKEGMGYGDFKLLAALGTWMGWQTLPVIIILSSLVGAIIGIIILKVSKQGKDTALPFGPYLAIAGWVAFFWGDQLIASYLSFANIS